MENEMDVLSARKKVLKNFLLLIFGEFDFFFVIVGHDGKGKVVAKRNYSAARALGDSFWV
jgi:hypothetical protein